jgi:hypothetical protein
MSSPWERREAIRPQAPKKSKLHSPLGQQKSNAPAGEFLKTKVQGRLPSKPL